MDRLELGYRHRFRSLLALVRPRRLDFGVDLLIGRARARSRREGVPPARAFAELYELTRRRVARRLEVTRLPLPRGEGQGEGTGACGMLVAAWDRFTPERPPRFVCDGGLGGLARWLRAAGYAARWTADCGAATALEQAQRDGVVLVTGDARVLERRPIRDGAVLAVWVPTGLPRLEQLRMVMRDLGLALREPRCMACGGALMPVAKDTVFPRIPPRTARWKDDYFVCAGCGQLFWQGTHWERIAARLAGCG